LGINTHPIFLNRKGVPRQYSGNFWVVLEEKRREIIKEWIEGGKIKDIQ